MRWKRSLATRRCMLLGCGRPEFGGRTTGSGTRRDPGRRMWSPRVRGADDSKDPYRAMQRRGCGRPDFGGGRQEGGEADVHEQGCGRPDLGGRTRVCGGSGRGGPRDVVASISGGGRQCGERADRRLLGCGRPDFRGRTTGRGRRGRRSSGMWSPRFRGADDRSQNALTTGTMDVVAPIPGADNERNGRAGRGRSSLEAGGSNGPGHRIGTKNGIDDRRRTSAR